MASKKTKGTKPSGGDGASASKTPQNKAAFVRSLSTDLPAKEVVAKAKAAGITFSEKYVYNIRHSAKVASGGKNVARRGPGRPVTESHAPPAPTTDSGTNLEELLRAVAAELGLGAAIGILETERSRVRAVFRA